MELHSVLRVLRERWKLITAVVVLVTTLAGILTWRETPLYASQVTLYVSASGGDRDAASAYQGSLLSEQKVKSYAELLRGQEVMSRVIKKRGLGLTPQQLSAKVTTSTIPDTALLTVTVTDPSPKRAQRIAADIGDEFVKLVPRLENTPRGKRPAVGVTVVSDAQLPTSPVSPRPLRNLGLALVIGLLAGFALAVARRSLDTTVKSAEQVNEITGAPSLGTVPYDPDCPAKPLVTQAPDGARAEALRKVCTSLRFIDVDRPDKVILVTSSAPDEGKSITACNLAIALAQAERRVILVDADLRRPDVTRYLGLPNGVGLTNVLAGETALHDVVQGWGENLFSVLASGPAPPDPGNLLGSRRMRDLLGTLRQEYDAVVIDTPPVLPVADTTMIAPACDGVLLVVRHGRTKLDQLRHVVTELHGVEAVVLGTVINRALLSRASYGYGYRYLPSGDRPRQEPSERMASATALDRQFSKTAS